MRYLNGIVESAFPPSNINNIWVCNSTIKYFSNGKWQAVGDNQGLVEELGAEVDYLGKAMGIIEKNVATLQKEKLSSVPAATLSSIGGVKMGAAIVDIAAEADAPTIVTSVNNLLAALRNAGIINT